MTFRLTNTDRDSVRGKAIQFAFGAREDALKAEEDAIGRAAYASIFPEKVRKLASQLPDKWLKEDKCLRLSFRGMQDQIHLISGVRVPGDHGFCNRLGNVADEDLCERFLKLKSDREDLNRQKNEADNNIKALLIRFSSLKTMQESWPDGARFYEHLKPREASSVPAIQVDTLNKMLGISKEQV